MLKLKGSIFEEDFSTIEIGLRPCVPKQRTKINQNTDKCLVDDINNRNETDKLLERAK